MPQVLSYGGDDLDTLCAWLLHRQALLPASMAATVASLNASLAAYPPPRQQQLCALARTYIAPIRHACAHLEFDLDPAETMHELQLSTGHRLHASLGSLAPLPPLLLFVPQLAAAFHTQAAATAVHCVPPLPDYGGRTVPSTQPSEWGDVWDDEYLAESAAPLRGAALGSATTMALNRTERDGDGDDDALRADLLAGVLYPRALDTTRDRVKTLASAQAPPLPQLSELGTRHVSGLSGDSTLDYTPLDEAIVRAVEKGKSTEVKRRLYGTILLLGGVSETPGLNRYLEWRIATCWKLAPDSTEGIERVEVFKLPPNVSPDCLVWRGAVELTSLKSARSMWLMSEDWVVKGVMAARERCFFSW